ncbi:hypothetical protein AAMO2058_000131500 [Amorphochlora amoebiformis]|eukprot:618852-Amorphochlora_amoeboformis.AAC.1
MSGLKLSDAEDLDIVEDGVQEGEEKAQRTTVLFHLLFKGLGIFFYVFASLIFGTENVIAFVVIVLLHAFDFWTVKNVTGRLLVGLRWWNEVNEDGSNNWIFESRPEGRQVNANESRIFWTALILTPLIWITFALTSLTNFNFLWFILCCVAITLSGTNLWGYYKCRYTSGTARRALANYAVGFMSSV